MTFTPHRAGRRAAAFAARLARALSLSALLGVAAMPAAFAGCDITTMEIPVRLVDHRPVATLVLNGVEVPMLVDSGAFFSVISPATATQLNLPLRPLPPGMRLSGHTGRIEAKRTVVEKVGLVGAELSNIPFIVGGNQLNAGIQGILGRNILSFADTEYDLAHGVVRLVFPKGDCADVNLAYWAGNAPVISTALHTRLRGETHIYADAELNGRRVRALMDTGAPVTTLTRRGARLAGISESVWTPVGRVGGAGEGRVNSWSAVVERFEFGGQKVGNSRLRIDDVESDDYDMIIGLDYFLAHRIYVSRLQGQLYATWNGGPIFAQNSHQGGDYDSRYAAVPEDIPADDIEALARRGAAALVAGNLSRALADLNRVCEVSPTAPHLLSRSRVHTAMRRPELALADLDAALRADPAFVDARVRRATVRASVGDRAGTLSDLVELDRVLPPSAHPRMMMAWLYAGFNELPGALRQYELWISTHPGDQKVADLLNARCWLRARLGVDLNLALEDCKVAVDRDRGSAAHRDSLGWTYLRLDDAARAKKAFDEAIDRDRTAFSLYGRGLAQLRLKDDAQSRADLAAARKLDPRIDALVRKEGFEVAPDAPAESPAESPAAKAAADESVKETEDSKS